MTAKPTILLAGVLESDISLSMRRYLQQITTGLEAYRTECDFRVVRPPGTAWRNRLLRAGVRHLSYPAAVSWAGRGAGSLLHVTDQFYAFLLPFARPCVATCHDLAEYRVTDLAPAQLQRWKKRVAHLRGADHVFAVSASTARDLTAFLGIDPARITVNPEQVDPGVFRRLAAQDMRTPAGRQLQELARRHVLLLHVGANLKRKNIPLLLQALAELRRQGVPALLVKAGEPLVKAGGQLSARDIGQPAGGGYAALARQLGVQDDILDLGPLRDAELVEVYNTCALLLFPSLCEGFGFPVLEAQACGLPCILANASSLPEVGGEGALYHDPHAVAPLVEAVLRVVREPDLRRDLVQRGTANVQRFARHRHVDQLVAKYRELLGNAA